jgi:hypothetical protein
MVLDELVHFWGSRVSDPALVEQEVYVERTKQGGQRGGRIQDWRFQGAGDLLDQAVSLRLYDDSGEV